MSKNTHYCFNILIIIIFLIGVINLCMVYDKPFNEFEEALNNYLQKNADNMYLYNNCLNTHNNKNIEICYEYVIYDGKKKVDIDSLTLRRMVRNIIDRKLEENEQQKIKNANIYKKYNEKKLTEVLNSK